MRATDPRSDRAALRSLLVDAVRDAGELALASLGPGLRTWHKADASPVSSADIAVNELLRARLTAATPAYGWLSEESADDPARLAAPRTWIVDPIDGTRSYVEGRPDWSVAVALVEEGRPILGAVFAPAERALFVAAAGDGATRNGVPISATGGSSLDRSRVAGPRRQLEQLAGLVPGIEPVPKIYSLALRLARVAQGTIDAALASRSAHDWDLAAADLLVHEAGGALTAVGGERPSYNRADPVHGSLIAAGGARHAALVDVLREHRRQFA